MSKITSCSKGNSECIQGKKISARISEVQCLSREVVGVSALGIFLDLTGEDLWTPPLTSKLCVLIKLEGPAPNSSTLSHYPAIYGLLFGQGIFITLSDTMSESDLPGGGRMSKEKRRGQGFPGRWVCSPGVVGASSRFSPSTLGKHELDRGPTAPSVEVGC